MHQERFSVEFSIEGTVEVLLPASATEAQINAAARKAIADEARKARSGLPGDVEIRRYEGPY